MLSDQGEENKLMCHNQHVPHFLSWAVTQVELILPADVTSGTVGRGGPSLCGVFCRGLVSLSDEL